MATALYRRYRPDTFAEVIGQEHVTRPLTTALGKGRTNHAYLFSGPRGCGKTTSARILARCLNCAQGPTPTPCGRCDSCVELARGGSGSVDVVEIDAASHNGVDDARDLRERVSFAPARDRYKVYILDEAHMVTTQGFNALLKTVEEPPEHVTFVFATTEPDKVLTTIRSRTHHYPFRLVPPATLRDYLEQVCRWEQVPVGKGVLPLVVRAGAGSVRDSLSVLDQLIAGAGEGGLTYDLAVALLGYTHASLLDDVVEALAARDAAVVFGVVERVVDSGQDPRRFVDDLLQRMRDLVIIEATGGDAGAVLTGVPSDQVDRMRGQAAHFGPAELSRAADIVNAALGEMSGAISPRVHLELLCARLLLPAADLTERGLAARLERLERRLGMPGQPAAAAEPASPPVTPAAAADNAVPSPPVTPGPARPEAPGPSGAPPQTADTAATPEPAAPGGADGASAPDTELVRRMWPEVLSRLFAIRRSTWTLVSQHASVHLLEGRTLYLNVTNAALASTFSRGAHAQLVREALIDELGLDVQVVASPADAGASPKGSPPAPAREPAPARGAVVAPEQPTAAQQGGRSTQHAALPTRNARGAAPAAAGTGAAPGARGRARPAAAPRRAGDTRDDEPRYDGVPLPDEPPVHEPPPDEPPLPDDGPGQERAPIRRVPTAASPPAPAPTVARAPTVGRVAPSIAAAATPATDADEPSVDDANADDSGLVGVPVVAMMLGATEIGPDGEPVAPRRPGSRPGGP